MFGSHKLFAKSKSTAIQSGLEDEYCDGHGDYRVSYLVVLSWLVSLGSFHCSPKYMPGMKEYHNTTMGSCAY